MKKESHKKYILLSFCVTGIYCILCFLSAGLITYGALEYNLNLFSVGKMLVPFWLLNPMGIVMALLGIRKGKHRLLLLINIAINVLCWLVAGMTIVRFY